VNRFTSALYSAIHVDTHRRQINNTDNTEAKLNAEKANNAKHSKTKLAWFSCLL